MKYADLISKMSLYEKVSLLSGKDFWSTKAIDRLKIPSMFLADGPHGLRKQAAESDHLGLNAGVPATCFPTSATIANSWDVELGEKVGEALGKEAALENVNVLLGPGLNIKRSPLCGRNFEYFSEDPYLSGKMAASYIRGIQSNGISACPKHFVANNQELFRLMNDSIVDKRTLHEIYLTGFEIAVKEAKPKSIMSAYNKINGTYANEYEWLLRDVLVEDWGFEGFVVSDWGGSNDHVDGVRSGAHLEMPATGGESERQLYEAVKNGDLSEDVLDERIDEYLGVVFSTQIGEFKLVDADIHHNLAREVAESSIVLLKNEESILPLRDNTKVALIGEFADQSRYQGAGSSLVNPTQLENATGLIDKTGLNCLGYSSGENIHEAQVLAEKAEVVLFYMGLYPSDETESLDRDHMRVKQQQIDLLETIYTYNENIVVVLSGGAAVEMPWINRCKGLVHGYLSGQAGASAILNIITGKVNPSGKLSESYPFKLKDTPAFNYYPGRERTSEYREGLFVGYRYYDTINEPVLFPFGYGLSYTTFYYSDLNVTENQISFKLTNMGERDGSEISQLYVSKESDKIFRPEKELKGFTKTFLKAGESRVVTIKLDDKAFRYFNVETDRFEVEGGEYILKVGSSSRNLKLSGVLNVEGTTEITYSYDKELYRNYFSGNIQNISDDEFSNLLGHQIPETSWNRKKPLERNDVFAQMEYAKSGLARFVFRVIRYLKERSLKKGNPDLNILFIFHIPFRGIEKMMGGAVSRDMVNDLLTVINGNFFKGITRFIRNYFKLQKKNRATADLILNSYKEEKTNG